MTTTVVSPSNVRVLAVILLRSTVVVIGSVEISTVPVPPEIVAPVRSAAAPVIVEAAARAIVAVLTVAPDAIVTVPVPETFTVAVPQSAAARTVGLASEANAAVTVFAVIASCASAIKIDAFKSPGQVENTQGEACDECNKYAEYLDKKDPCVCHATDSLGTFANDATKESSAAVGHDTVVSNTGAERLPEGWMWHCRPISSTEGLWNQC